MNYSRIKNFQMGAVLVHSEESPFPLNESEQGAQEGTEEPVTLEQVVESWWG